MTKLATTPAILGILVGGMLAASLAAGCGSNKVEIGSQNVDAQASAPDAAAGRGGAVAGGSGGSATGGATGGVTGSDGGALAGGTVGAGGAVGTGGVALAGGTVGAGGISPTGGTAGSGGTVGAGGATPNGGTTRTGGTTPNGGSMGSGGATRTGGTAASGGATRSGGVAGTGGTGGSTGKICGPMLDGVCADGEICNGPPGACNLAGWTGTCVVKPQGCTADWQPVCGCDGKTYSNDCTRLVAGVSRKNFDGACPTTDAGADGSTGKTCGGIAGVTCPTGEYCQMPAGSCNGAHTTGTCVVQWPHPELTCPIGGPTESVCSCNGLNYFNDCWLQAGGVSKRSDGPCPIPDSGTPDTDGTTPCFNGTGKCAAGEFCDIGAGLCHTDLRPQSCVVKPKTCDDVSQPVCGCDGKTYNNDCERQAAGVSKLRDVACETPNSGRMIPTLPAACLTDDDCCVAMDHCIATAYLVGRTEYAAMLESIIEADSTRLSCMPCINPVVQVQCKGGFCAGEEGSGSTASHCGYIGIPDASAPTSSAHAAVDAGTAAQSIWGCTASY